MLVSTTNIWEILIRLGAAILFGAIIGIDREWRNKPAGVRTHMMVALAAATFTVITMEGITTGSGIWLAGAVGYAAGAGYDVLGAIATVLALVILTVFGWIVGKMKANGNENANATKRE